ncbi:MAG: hypothetical protein Q8J89_01695 [Caulobacter sp.]|nr:hypothetical protein [Caulobacter sp.]
MSDTPPLAGLSVLELVRLHVAVLSELQSREVLRTANGVAGDYAELLFVNAFGWAREANSAKAYDATCSQGIKYQIKGRRLTSRSASRQLSSIRSLEEQGFDWLAVVLFDARFDVSAAALVPFELVQARARRDAHVNGYRMMMPRIVWALDGVRDVTAQVAAAQAALA